MLREFHAPLLRGIGTTIVLLATIISVLVARHQVQAFRSRQQAARAQVAQLISSAPDAEQESVMDEVLENPWFEWAGSFGTAVIASSFFTEWYVRRKKSIA